MYIHVRG